MLIINNRQARLNGFDENLGLDDQGYNTAVALLTVGCVRQSILFASQTDLKSVT
jgi:hypothetical protein